MLWYGPWEPGVQALVQTTEARRIINLSFINLSLIKHQYTKRLSHTTHKKKDYLHYNTALLDSLENKRFLASVIQILGSGIWGVKFTKTGSHHLVTFDKQVTFLHFQHAYRYRLTPLYLMIYISKKIGGRYF